MQPPLLLFLPDAAWWWSQARLLLWGVVVAGTVWRGFWAYRQHEALAWWGSRLLPAGALLAVLAAGVVVANERRSGVIAWWALPAGRAAVQSHEGHRVVALYGVDDETVLSWRDAMALTAWRYSEGHAPQTAE